MLQKLIRGRNGSECYMSISTKYRYNALRPNNNALSQMNPCTTKRHMALCINPCDIMRSLRSETPSITVFSQKEHTNLAFDTSTYARGHYGDGQCQQEENPCSGACGQSLQIQTYSDILPTRENIFHYWPTVNDCFSHKLPNKAKFTGRQTFRETSRWKDTSPSLIHSHCSHTNNTTDTTCISDYYQSWNL